MVLCECGKKWWYEDEAAEWVIEGDNVKTTVMKSGPPDFETTELVIYQCPCGKINGIVAFDHESEGSALDWGVFTHPDWDDKDIDAYIEP